MSLGKLLISAGAILLIIGLLVTYAPGLINWFGKLPGDIRIENNKSFVFIPLTSMIIISVVITLLLNLIFRK